MLDMIVTNFEDIFQALCERQRRDKHSNCLDYISTLNKDEISAITLFLKPFKDMTDRLEGDKCETLSTVWPTYSKVHVILKEDHYSDDNSILQIIENMKLNGRKYIEKNNNDFEPTMKHKVACVLHPFYKHLPNVSERDRKEVYRHIESLIEKTPDDSEDPCPTTSTRMSQLDIEELDPFFHSFYSFDHQNEPDKPPSELENYLKLPVVPCKIETKTWWNNNANNYPELHRLYAKISSIPASTGSGERSFSLAGLVLTSRRSRVLPANVNNLIVASNNL